MVTTKVINGGDISAVDFKNGHIQLHGQNGISDILPSTIKIGGVDVKVDSIDVYTVIGDCDVATVHHFKDGKIADKFIGYLNCL